MFHLDDIQFLTHMSEEGSQSKSLGPLNKDLFLSGHISTSHHQKEAPHSHIFVSVAAQVSDDFLKPVK